MLALEGSIQNVVRGKNRRLFLGDQEPFSIQRFTGGAPFSPSELLAWKRTLQRRATEFKRRGIPYVFYITPDAHSIFPEDLPDFIHPSPTTAGEIFLKEMDDVEDVIFVYPRPQLLAAKGGLDLYRKNDSHWTEYGSFIAYGVLIDAMRPHVNLTRIRARDVEFKFRRSFGDLGTLVEPEQVEQIPVATMPRHQAEVVFENEGVGRIQVKETHSLTAEQSRAMFFRDSFMSDQAVYIFRSFSNVLMAGTTTRVYLDAVDDWKPDIVISQVAERRLSLEARDHQLDRFDDTFRMDCGSPHGKLVSLGMLHVDRGDAAGALEQIASLRHDPDLAPGYAFEAAKICAANGDWAGAEALMENARSRRPSHASYQCFAAKIQLALGRCGEALQLARSAVELAPYNGFYQEVYIYSLITAGEYQRAREHANDALSRIFDSGFLWYWGSIAREKAGDIGNAAEAAEQAVALLPNHPPFLDQAEKFRTQRRAHAGSNERL